MEKNRHFPLALLRLAVPIDFNSGACEVCEKKTRNIRVEDLMEFDGGFYISFLWQCKACRKKYDSNRATKQPDSVGGIKSRIERTLQPKGKGKKL